MVVGQFCIVKTPEPNQKMQKILTMLVLAMLTISGFAQNGTIRGTVTDGETGETMIGAAVIIVGSNPTKGGSTDLDGKYEIPNVEPGNYKLMVRMMSYANDTVDITVKADDVIIKDFLVGSSAILIENEVEIVAKMNRAGDAHMDRMRKQEASLMDGMSAQQIARAGDSNVASAVKRGVGVTVEGGKYVYVRGLSDRYSKTTLNGAEIPGLDPNRNAVQMDLFPTNLVDNLTILKSFSPDLPASFTGGLVNIETKDFPDQFTLQFSSSVSFNPQSNFKSGFISDKKGKTDFLAFDDGTRAVPLMMQNRIVPTRFSTPNANDRISTYAQSFDKAFEPERITSGLDQSYSFSIGNQTDLFKNKFGYIFGLTYSKSFDYYQNGMIGRYSLTGTESSVDQLNSEIILDDEQGSETVLWGALANLSYKMGANHKVSMNLMRNQNGISTARYQEGNFFQDAQDLFIQTRTLQYLERSLTSGQLKGEHYFENMKKLKVDWLGSYVVSTQDEPDLRFFTNDYVLSGNSDQDTIYSIQEALYVAPARYYRDMTETNIDTKVNFELPFKSKDKDARLKFGFSNVNKERLFNETRYNFRSQNVSYNGNPEDYLADENMNVGSSSYIYLEGNEGEDRRNSYVGTDNVLGGYAMTDLYVSQNIRMIVGARFEQTNILLYSLDGKLDQGVLENNDILPALNLSWDIHEKMKIRGAFSRTLARPNFRELAPFANFNFVGGFVTVGNPNLTRTLIDNFDLRYEFYPNPSEIISVSAFGKIFTDPIERTFNPLAVNNEMTFLNVDQATVYGMELEVRKSLNFISEKMANYAVGGNVTLVHSEVTIQEDELAAIRAVVPDHPETRQMFGQAPFIVNSFVNYRNDSIGLSANLSFNISGNKLAVVGTKGMPNVLEAARGQLDFNVSKNLGDKFAVKVGTRNLLNPDYRYTQEFNGAEYIFRNYKIGRTFQLGLKYNIN